MLRLGEGRIASLGGGGIFVILTASRLASSHLQLEIARRCDSDDPVGGRKRLVLEILEVGVYEVFIESAESGRDGFQKFVFTDL